MQCYLLRSFSIIKKNHGFNIKSGMLAYCLFSTLQKIGVNCTPRIKTMYIKISFIKNCYNEFNSILFEFLSF